MKTTIRKTITTTRIAEAVRLTRLHINLLGYSCTVRRTTYRGRKALILRADDGQGLRFVRR